jgi:hypothetical protein
LYRVKERYGYRVMSGIIALPLNAPSIGSKAKQVLKNNKGSVVVGTILAAPGLVDSYSKGEYVSGTLKAGGEVGGTVIASKILEPVTKPVNTFIDNKLGGKVVKTAVKKTGKSVISGAAKLGKNALSGAVNVGKSLLPKVSSKAASSVLKSVGPKVLTKGGYVGLAVGGVLIATGVIIGLTSGKSEAKPVNKSETDKKAPELPKKKIFDDANIDKQPTVAEPEYENKASIIDGNDGTFGEVKTDAKGNLDYENSVKYGLNAGLNINEIDSEKYEVKYLPGENITEEMLKDNGPKANNLKAALIAEAVAELGGNDSVTVEGFKKLGFTNPESYDFTGENGEPDGIITAAEYAAANLYIDANDTADGKIDGKYTNTGVAKLGSMLQKNSTDENRQIFKQYYDKFGLAQAEAYINKQEAEKSASAQTVSNKDTTGEEIGAKKDNEIKYTINKGDTLYEIVQAKYPNLKTHREIMAKVREIAKKNGIKNINLIYTNNTLILDEAA